jgi:hypothetical protein
VDVADRASDIVTDDWLDTVRWPLMALWSPTRRSSPGPDTAG